MPDLVSGQYGLRNPLTALLGITNVAQPSVPARSNLEFGLANPTDGVIATSTNTTAAAVPCDAGTVITNVSMIIGAGTASSTPTHSFVALYSGATSTGAANVLLANSADQTTTAITASAALTIALSAPYTVKASDVPNGYLYVAYGPSATAVPSGLVVATPTAITYQWFTAATTPKGATPFLSCTVATTTPGTPNANLTGAAAKAVAPIFILS